MYDGNIVFCYDGSSEGSRSAMWLCTWPAAALQDAGYFVESMTFHDALHPGRKQRHVLDRANIIIYERHIDDAWLPFLDWAANEKRLVLLLDDAYWTCDQTTATYRFWSQKDRLEKLELVAGEAEKVVTPNRKLSSHFDNGYFKPNRPNFKDLAWSVAPLYGERTIIWGGTEGHIAGMVEHPCLSALSKLDDVTIVALPGSPRLEATLTQALPSVRIAPFQPFSEWLTILSGASISICPLGQGYDEYRSWIKALESAAVGTVWVGSDRGVYDECRGGILVPDTEQAWSDTLNWLLDDEESRLSLREEGLEWAWRQGLHDHLDEWEAIFDEV